MPARIATVTAALLVASLAHGQLRNTGFEILSGTRPGTWTHFGNVFTDQTTPKTGVRSLKHFGNFTGGANTTGSSQSFSIRPGDRVYAGVWAHNRSADPMAGNNYGILKVAYRNAANVELATRESKQINAATPRNQWQLLSASLGDAPSGTTQCNISLLFVQPASTPFASGAVHFDDVEAVISPPESVQKIWTDDFRGTTLDTEKWEPMIGDGSAYGIPGWGNDELQYYTDRPANLSIANGLLKIIARRENFGGKQYTSARIRTRGKFDVRYGRFEARMKVPAGQGLWSAFWMLPSSAQYGTWASSGEIDIMETINSADRLYTTIHHGGTWPNNTSTGGNVFRSTTFADGFHLYAVEWEPDSIRWFFNGVEVYSLQSPSWFSSAALWNQRAPFDQPFHLLLNLAVGGNWPGSPTLSTPFPAELQVDWVRVTQRRTAKLPTDHR